MSYFHEEQTFSRWLAWGIAAVVGIPAAAAVVEWLFRPGLLVPSLLSIAVFLPIAAIFFLARLVVDVDERGIHVSFHLLWPTRHIPLDDVQRAHATAYSPLADYGGWGVRLSWRGWAFNTGGAEGVLVETKSGKRIMIGSRRAKDLEAGIATAMAARSA